MVVESKAMQMPQSVVLPLSSRTSKDEMRWSRLALHACLTTSRCLWSRIINKCDVTLHRSGAQPYMTTWVIQHSVIL
jgi:hypothetical protein